MIQLLTQTLVYNPSMHVYYTYLILCWKNNTVFWYSNTQSLLNKQIQWNPFIEFTLKWGHPGIKGGHLQMSQAVLYDINSPLKWVIRTHIFVPMLSAIERFHCVPIFVFCLLTHVWIVSYESLNYSSLFSVSGYNRCL